jgi:hypothetical protein
MPNLPNTSAPKIRATKIIAIIVKILDTVVPAILQIEPLINLFTKDDWWSLERTLFINISITII